MGAEVGGGVDAAGVGGRGEWKGEGGDGGAGVEIGAEVGVGRVADGGALEGDGGGGEGARQE